MWGRNLKHAPPTSQTVNFTFLYSTVSTLNPIVGIVVTTWSVHEEAKAEQKREDIGEAVESRAESKGMRGGKGRRSLFRAGGGGFLDRFS